MEHEPSISIKRKPLLISGLKLSFGQEEKSAIGAYTT